MTEYLYYLKSNDAEVAETIELPCGITPNDISDGYHSIKELYEFRKVYNAALFNEWARKGEHEVYKSWKHHDGQLCFGGGWFIVVALLPTGQISNHYEESDWDLFQIPAVETALLEYDDHDSVDVLERLKAFILGDIT
jgi:hypothetical protein